MLSEFQNEDNICGPETKVCALLSAYYCLMMNNISERIRFQLLIGDRRTSKANPQGDLKHLKELLIVKDNTTTKFNFQSPK